MGLRHPVLSVSKNLYQLFGKVLFLLFLPASEIKPTRKDLYPWGWEVLWSAFVCNRPLALHGGAFCLQQIFFCTCSLSADRVLWVAKDPIHSHDSCVRVREGLRIYVYMYTHIHVWFANDRIHSHDSAHNSRANCVCVCVCMSIYVGVYTRIHTHKDTLTLTHAHKQ